MSVPTLHVVMPKKNAEAFVAESISGIQRQSFEDFQLVVLDDSSTDRSSEIVARLARQDRRIRLVRVDGELGFVGSLNQLIPDLEADIVARMDADDVSMPDRLARQLDVITSVPDAVLVGTLSEGIDSSGAVVHRSNRRRLMSSEDVAPFPHGSVMFKRKSFVETGGYRETADGWEDLDLYLRLSRLGRVLVLSDPLYRYRYHLASMTTSTEDDRRARSILVRQKCIRAFRAGDDYTDILTDEESISSRQLAKARPMAEVVRAALQLWSGVRPDPRPRFVNALSAGPATAAKTALYGSVGRVAPRLLRRVLAVSISIRDRGVASRFPRRATVEWPYARS